MEPETCPCKALNKIWPAFKCWAQAISLGGFNTPHVKWPLYHRSVTGVIFSKEIGWTAQTHRVANTTPHRLARWKSLIGVREVMRPLVVLPTLKKILLSCFIGCLTSLTYLPTQTAEPPSSPQMPIFLRAKTFVVYLQLCKKEPSVFYLVLSLL